MIVRVDGGRARITDADGGEVTVPRLRELGPSLGATPVLLDGELAGPVERAELWIGDLLHLDGRDTCPLPFRERRALLERLPLDGPHWRLAPVFPDGGAEVVAAAAQQGLPVCRREGRRLALRAGQAQRAAGSRSRRAPEGPRTGAPAAGAGAASSGSAERS